MPQEPEVYARFCSFGDLNLKHIIQVSFFPQKEKWNLFKAPRSHCIHMTSSFRIQEEFLSCCFRKELKNTNVVGLVKSLSCQASQEKPFFAMCSSSQAPLHSQAE